MSVTFREGEFAPFGKCLFISNGSIEAAVTLDIGPRIISFKGLGGENIMYADTGLANKVVDPSIGAAYNKPTYYFYGGHRLWWTPERIPETYFPDDDPVKYTVSGSSVEFIPPEQPSGVQLSFVVTMDESEAKLTIAQKVTNTSNEARRHAAWGITQCRKGGIAVAPQNTRQCAPLPNRVFVHWPYNDMLDERFNPGERYITLCQTSKPRAFKYGMNNEAGWCGYVVGGQLLRKEFPFDAAEQYPDYGCNFESYTDATALEIESLSGEKLLEPGESVELTERWSLLALPEGELPAPTSEAFAEVIDAAIKA